LHAAQTLSAPETDATNDAARGSVRGAAIAMTSLIEMILPTGAKPNPIDGR